MSIKIEPDFYSRKSANLDQLVEFINAGDIESKVELQGRLQHEAQNLLRLYELAYDDAALVRTKITADLASKTEHS
ncbi:hypothetical protein ACLPHM_02875 [Paenalcaligenes sp. Me131]|uniref:hypothetical protein n=1 Tax=Paenalcaligenes sp. Me131 TaxID=3392636 RepID=UPI003D290521